MKRILCVILILLMLIPPMAASAAGEPSFAIAGAEGRKGETVQVVVSAANLPDCASLELILQYDTSVLKPTAHAKGALTGLYVGNLAYSIRENDGIGKVGETAIKIAASTSSTTTPLLSGDATLITLTFELLADPGAEGAKVELLKYSLSRMDADLTKITGIPLPTGYVTREQARACAVTPPTKTTYYTGDALNLEGGSIWLAYADDDQETIALSDLPEGAVTGYDPLQVGPQEISVTYAGQTGRFQIELLELLPIMLEVTKQPTKTSYVVGQQFDLAGGELTLTYNSGAEETVPLTNAFVDENAEYELQEGWCMIPLTYKGQNTTVSIYFEARALVSLSVMTPPAKTTYVEGQALDRTGGVLLATYNDESTEEIAMSDPLVGVAGYDPAAVGIQEVTLNYKGQQTALQVTVIKKAVESITVKTAPKTQYVEGQPFDLGGGELTATYNDGDTEDIPFSDAGVAASGYDPSTLGEQTIDVTYAGKTAQYTVTVIAKAEEMIELISAPDKKTYIQGEALDLTGGKIRIYYNDGDQKEQSIVASMVSGYQAGVAGPQTVTVTVGGKQTEFSVTVLSLAEAPYICLSGGEGVVGQTVTVTLSTLRAPASGGFQLEFSYDPSLLQPIAWTDGLADNLVPNNSALGANPGVLKLGGLYEVPFSGTRTLGTITFRLLAPGTAEINFEGGFLTGETFGADPLTQTTVLSEIRPIRIKAKEVERIALTAPAKTVYWMGEGLDFTGSSAVAYYNDGTYRAVSPASMTVSGFNDRVGGKQTVTLTYDGKSTSFEVVVLKKHPFTDVSNNIWYYTNQSVPYVYTLGLMNGMTATTFGGEGETTRAQLVTILYRLEGQPSVSGDDGFSDVGTNDWYYNAVLWASKKGIVNGYADGTFAPDKPVSRAEMAVIFYRYTKDYKKLPTNARADLSGFADRAEIGTWCADAISWAVAEGLMTGMPGNLFAPGGTANRAQIATVLMRYVERNRK